MVAAMRIMHYGALALLLPLMAMGADAKIKKVLPHYLDQEGRHTLSPSLYERDAYQAFLRDHPEARSAMRFKVLYKASSSTNLYLRVELRGSKDSAPTRLQSTSPRFSHKGGREWNGITIPGEEYDGVGKVLAWKVTLLEGDTELTQQSSFLWQSTGSAGSPK